MKSFERVLWSIALPGFGQLLNKKYIKAIIFLFLEYVINVKANFNTVIQLSFLGEIEEAIIQTNYNWLMFYPSLYFVAIWDALKDASEETNPYSFIFFVMPVFFLVIGLMYSRTFTIFGVLLGPVWLPMLCVIPGLIVGLLWKTVMKYRQVR